MRQVQNNNLKSPWLFISDLRSNDNCLMIRENQLYEASVFLMSYKDALLCLQQVAIKNKIFEHYQEKYLEVKPGNENPETLKLFKFSQ